MPVPDLGRAGANAYRRRAAGVRGLPWRAGSSACPQGGPAGPGTDAGIMGYLAAAWSVVAATALVGLALAVRATALGGGLSDLIGARVRRLRDTHSAPGGTVMAVLGISLTVLAYTAGAGVARLRAGRRQTLYHARAIRLVGYPVPTLEATVVDHPSPVAYCLAGRQPMVVLTTGTLRVLSPAQLAAVLAHERAHLASRHHPLMAVARAGRLALPFVPLLREADAQVPRLAELHADAAAARAGDPGLLAAALVIPAAGGSYEPALAASATDVIHRVTRLLRPAQRAALRAGVAALARGPVLLSLTPALVSLALGPIPAP
jgi:Zn-dependent protease with chaperone function